LARRKASAAERALFAMLDFVLSLKNNKGINAMEETLDAIYERIKALEGEVCALRVQNNRLRARKFSKAE